MAFPPASLALAASDVAFVNWAVPPESVRPLVPPGTEPDLWEGTAYVGLVALRMVGVRPSMGPAVPYLSTFPQVNVRTYVVDRNGRRGLVFVSMAAARLLPALAGRLSLGLPYRWARVRLDRSGDFRTYRRRRGDSAGRLTLRVGEALPEPSPLVSFLTERNALYQRRGGRTWRLPNSHDPWPLHRAEAVDAGEPLVRQALDREFALGKPAAALWSPGVRMRFGIPRPLGRD